jgi:CHAT domain-containing protein/Tfp pilus assembly protein PilF
MKILQGLYLLVATVLLVRCTSPTIVATQAIQKGDEYNNLNRYNDAIVEYEEYLKISPQLGVYRNTTTEAEVSRKLAYAYSTQGKYKQSLNYLNKALRIDSTTIENDLGVVEDYRQIGLVNAYAGNYKEALRNLEKSIRLNQGMEKSNKTIKQSSVADTYLALAQVNLTLGNYSEANDYATRALLIYSKLPEGYSGVLESQLLIGIVARDKGDLKKAVERIEMSRKIAEQYGLNTARHLQALGEVYFMQGEMETSIRYKGQALTQAEKSNIKPQIIIATMRMGDAWQQLGDMDKANEFYTKALKIQAEMSEGDTLAFVPGIGSTNLQQSYAYYMRSGSAIGAGLVSLRMGDLQLASNKIDSAQIMFTQAKKYFTAATSNEGKARSNIGLAKILISKKMYAEALQVLDESLKQTIQPELKWQIYFQTGVVKENQNQIDEARQLYEQSIGVIDNMRTNLSVDELKTLFANTKVNVYDRLIWLLVNNKNKWTSLSAQQAVEKAFNLNEQARSRTFLDMLSNKQVEPKKNTDTLLLGQEHLLRLKINQLVQQINQAQEQSELRRQLTNELEVSQQEHKGALDKIKLSNAAYASVVSVEPPTLPAIQSKIDDQTALLEYWVGDESLIIWVVTKSKIETEVVSVSRKELLRQVSAARRGISLQLEDLSLQTLGTLHKYLIQPVELKIPNTKNLIIVPHRSLHFLPFQALQNGSGKFLIEQYVISYAPSSSVYYYCVNRVPEAGNSFLGLAIGDITIGGFPGLPGTEVEINQLSKIYPTFNKQTKSEFLETSFKQGASRYNYIHIATHGSFNKQQPLYSYLLMGNSDKDDGRLTVNEIFGLDIKSKVVVLSACETAMGDLSEADELVGLSRAFIYAGTPEVVVSLWKVDDATTAWLMTRFHQYLSGGYKSAEAITYAQRDLIQRNFTASQGRGIREIALEPQIKSVINAKSSSAARNPYFWAPFVLIGNGAIN